MNPILESSKDFFMCECGVELLQVLRFKDEKEYYLTIYTAGQYNKKPNLWERLKYCWFHLKTGNIYGDEIILPEEEAIRLSDWIKNDIENENKRRDTGQN